VILDRVVGRVVGRALGRALGRAHRRIAGRVLGGAIVGVVVLAGAASAQANPTDDLSGSYDVKFEQVSTNCEHPLAYPPHGSLKIELKAGDLQVDIDRTPLMIGKPAKSDKIRKINAKSPKPGHTPVEGMDGVFSVAGRITDEGMLSLVMIGEYQTAGKPLCTQSWNLSGLRARPDKADKADKPEKPKK
jgi:hypothetical protein